MQDIHNRQAGVEADKIRESQRTHRLIGAELHRLIDVRGRGDALVQNKNRFVDHRHENAIDREARHVFDRHESFAEFFGNKRRHLSQRYRRKFASRECPRPVS